MATLPPSRAPKEYVRQRSLVDGVFRANAQDAVAEPDRAFAGDLGIADAHSVESRAVERAVVLDAPDAAVAQYSAMKPRDGGVAQDQVVRRVGPYSADLARVNVLALALLGLLRHVDRELGKQVDHVSHGANGRVALQDRRALVRFQRCRRRRGILRRTMLVRRSERRPRHHRT